MAIRRMISMERTAPEKMEANCIAPMQSKYDYGLCISLNTESLAKLDLDTDDVEVGDMIHLVCMAEVTGLSKNDNGSGPQHRIELQITHMSVAEDESTEYGE